MEIFIDSFLIFCAIATIWSAICNSRTHDQRINTYLPKHDDKDFWGKIKTMDSVSYSKHFWYLFTFRDPSKLYNRDAQATS